MAQIPQRGLPPRVYVPIMLLLAAAFLGAMGYLVHAAFSTGGSVFGASTGAGNQAAAPAAAPPAVSVQGGGPPAGVRTQLADMYLAVGKYAEAIPYYKRALAANPNNVAAKEGLSEAESESKEQ